MYKNPLKSKTSTSTNLFSIGIYNICMCMFQTIAKFTNIIINNYQNIFSKYLMKKTIYMKISKIDIK